MYARTLADTLKAELDRGPVVLLTGPRGAGKTTLARVVRPDFRYVSLDDPLARQDAVENPDAFLDRVAGATGVILDEVQRAPDIVEAVHRRARSAGHDRFLLTASGRVAAPECLELLPLALSEWWGFEPGATFEGGEPPPAKLEDVLLVGTFPQIREQTLEPAEWVTAYVRDFVEREARAVGDPGRFARFVVACAGCVGALVNASALGAAVGVSHVTAKRWLAILEAGYVVELVPPLAERDARSTVRAPKLYFVDTGVACGLLGLRRAEDLGCHPQRGAIFENLVVMEFRKRFAHRGERARLSFWRDAHGRKIDLIVERESRRTPVQIRAGKRVGVEALEGLDSCCRRWGETAGVVVYGGATALRRRGHDVRPWFACVTRNGPV